MNTQQKKAQKKKEREKKVKEKLAVRRAAIRRDAKERSVQEKMERELQVLKHGKPEPILNDPAAVERREERKKAQVKERLQKNLKLLEALESEYDEEQDQRQRVQENLESEGHKSIKDKLVALHSRAKELQSMTEAVKELGKPKENTEAVQSENTQS